MIMQSTQNHDVFCSIFIGLHCNIHYMMLLESLLSLDPSPCINGKATAMADASNLSSSEGSYAGTLLQIPCATCTTYFSHQALHDGL